VGYPKRTGSTIPHDSNAVNFQLMADPSPDVQREFELARSELKLALTFAKVSSAKFAMGKLQHASDARCKAEAVRARAMAHLIEAAAGGEGDDAIESMLGEVQEALARLPSSNEPYFWMQRAMRSSG